MRIVTRVAIIALAAAMFVGITGLLANFQAPDRHSRFELERRRRPSEPQWNRLPSFLGEFVLIGVIAAAGRTILRLRLAANEPSDSRTSLRYPGSTPLSSHPPSSTD